jgi:hypothetical protein
MTFRLDRFDVDDLWPGNGGFIASVRDNALSFSSYFGRCPRK